jgi:iron complex outermembrane receptor protein
MGRRSHRNCYCRIGHRALVAALLATVALPASMALVGSDALAQATGQTGFNIAAGPLNRVLAAFGNQSGTQVSYEASIASGKTSPGVRGAATREQAVAQILQGTGLQYSFTDPSSVLITRPNPASGAVAADGSLLLDTIDVEGRIDTAFGPQNGFISQDSGTGTKTETPIVETPFSVSVVNRKQLDDQNPQSLPEALRYTPGVVTGFFGADNRMVKDQIYIRGFGGDASQLYWNGLGLAGDSYVNSPTLDPYLLQQIEVLRGPASVLYGQTAPGGVINARSKLPTETPYHEVVVGTGSHGRLYSGFDFSGPLTKDGDWLYRVTGVGYRAGTQVDDTTYERLAIAPTLTWQPDDDTNLTVFATYQNDPDGVGFQSLPLEGTLLPSPTGKIPTSFNFGEPDYDYLKRETASIGYEFEHHFNETWKIAQNFRYLHADGTYREVQPDGWAAGSGNTIMDRWNWGTDGSLDAVAVDNQVEARFDTGAVEHTALFGLDYRNQWTDVQHYWARLNVPTLDFLNPVYGLPVGEPSLIADTKGTLEQTGIYAQDQMEFGNWRFLVGGRQDWAETSSTNMREEGNPKTTEDSDAFTWRTGVVYLFDNGFAPYASYATSFLPIGGTDFSGNTFEPTTAQQYEIGLKYQPAGLESFVQLSLFDLRQQNLLTSDDEHSGFSVQTGEIRSRGVEVSGVLALNDSVNLLASYTYTDLQTTKANPETTGFDPNGRVPFYYPTQVASIWGDYTFSSGSLAGLRLGAGVRYVGSAYNGPQEEYKVPGYTLVDAALTYDFGVKSPQLDGLELNINVNNLSDKQYLARCSEINCSWGIRRNILANLKYRW